MIIGIDFGTTNCTLAYAKDKIEQFSIPQLISASETGLSLTLPSFIYFPLPEEKAANESFIGHYAKARGAEVPLRLISSAKSWLCHAGINRRESFLPLGEEEVKKSPVDACKDILLHLKNAWDEKETSFPFVDQQIFITVPASFDPSARQLILEAAELAGYPEVVLLEEPQAALYSWLHELGDEWRKHLSVGDQVLVVDIGGGTTDFSVVTVEDENGSMALQRVAVGNHLLLGGDNIDLALAYLVKEKLSEQGHEIDEWQLKAAAQSCRQAKEMFFGENPKKTQDIVIMGRGSRLIGKSLKVALDYEEVENLVVDGFFPMIGPDNQSKVENAMLSAN